MMAERPSGGDETGHDGAPQRRIEAVRDYERIQQLFWQAVENPPEERVNWVYSQSLPPEIARRLLAAVIADLGAEAETQEPDAHDAALAETISATSGMPLHGSRARRLPEIQNYEIIEEIDRGGMGIVYKARQFRPDRLVAIKMMRMGAFSSAQDVERFLHEANAASQLAHAAVVPVYEVGDVHGEPFIVMKFIEGVTLEKLLQRNALTTTDAIKKLRVVANAIADAHEHGIIHRDLKPSNILIDQKTGQLTSAGDIMGTPRLHGSGNRDWPVQYRFPSSRCLRSRSNPLPHSDGSAADRGRWWRLCPNDTAYSRT
jgi:predicted Ser/Thr protein kinase